MKKLIILLASAAVALSLAACTPTPQKQAETAEMPPTTEAFKADTMEIRNSGIDEPELATVSVYRVNNDRTGLLQEMDALETEELEAQGIIDLMISEDYAVLEDDVELLGFEVNDGKGVLNLSKITSDEDEMEIRLVVESLVNTFTENYELENGLILQVNGEVYTIDSVKADEDGAMYYNDAYRKLADDSEEKESEEGSGSAEESTEVRELKEFPEAPVLQ